MTTVAITGATGTIGHHLVELLACDPTMDVRIASRKPDAGTWDGTTNVTMVGFDWQHPDHAQALLTAADLVVVIPPSGQHPQPTTDVLLAQATTAGVRHVILVSTFGAELQPGFAFGRWARAAEQAVVAAGLGWTIVRPNSYMSNFAGMLGPGPDGLLRLPWGDGATSFVDPADVSAALAAVIREPDRHSGAVYEVTGPAALTCLQIADILSESSGTPVRYAAVSVEQVRDRMITGGAPAPFVEALVELHLVMATRARARVTDDVRRLTGHFPRSLGDWSRARFTGRTSGNGAPDVLSRRSAVAV